MSVERTLREVADRQAIAEVLHAYCRALDLMDLDAVATVFTADCMVSYGPEARLRSRGAAAVARAAAAVAVVADVAPSLEHPDRFQERARGAGDQLRPGLARASRRLDGDALGPVSGHAQAHARGLADRAAQATHERERRRLHREHPPSPAPKATAGLDAAGHRRADTPPARKPAAEDKPDLAPPGTEPGLQVIARRNPGCELPPIFRTGY
jgi:hypothetical protein